jgi:hypothetical protein
VPIRLSLRSVKGGENPEKVAKQAPDTPESSNAAGKVAQKLDMSEEARAFRQRASEDELARRQGLPGGARRSPRTKRTSC